MIIAPGTYREALVVPPLTSTALRTTIRAEQPGTVVIKGSILAGEWQSVRNDTWTRSWTGEEPEQVFRAGKPLFQVGGTVFGGFPTAVVNELNGVHQGEGGIWPGRIVGGIGQLIPDSFSYDAATRTLAVRLSTPLGVAEQLEVSSVPTLLAADNANGLTLDGLVFEHSNTSFAFRQGAVRINGNRNTVSNTTIRLMDAFCLQLNGDDNTVTKSTLSKCGQAGLNARGYRATITDNQVVDNNTRGFNAWWEAGGMKLVGDNGLHDSVVRNNLVARNNGSGIWLDYKNTNITIEGNTTAYNAHFGIHYEASQGATIRSNVSYANGLRGIYLSESSYSTIEGNSVFGNRLEGVVIVDGSRSATDASLRPFGNIVRGNSIAWNDSDNYVQFIVPGSAYANYSDRNVFKMSGVLPRYSVGFTSTYNQPSDGLAQWRPRTGLDLSSQDEIADMPAAIGAGIAAQRIFLRTELPLFLQVPGVP